GSDEKVAYIKKLGADVAFNYKTTKTEDALKSFGKLDVYWDNVGGAQADAALGNMNNYGRIIVCGTASSYSDKPFGMTVGVYQNWGQILVRRLQINGYLQGEIKHKHEELFWKTIPDKLVAGEIQFQESVYHGFSKAPDAFDDLMKGKNEGKVIVML
ncbi:NAD(P)-binding protein, partial [Atractiella rhizophila]